MKDAAIPVRHVIVLAISVAAILAFTVSAQTYLSMLGHGHSFQRILLWQLGTWSFWAGAAPFVLRRGALWTGRQRLSGYRLQLLLLGAMLCGSHMMVASLLAVWLQPFVPVVTYDFAGAMTSQLPALFAIDILVFVLLLVGGSAFFTHRRASYLELRESRLEAELVRTQLHALRLEVEPHFLFNTLNTIAALIRARDNPRALDMLVGLSEFMRSNLDRPREAFTPLVSEIEWVRQYIALQQARFGERLEVQYEIDDRCQDAVVPSWILQPLVENALRHGAGRLNRRCTMIIGAAMEHGRLRLWVADDGGGLPDHFDLDKHSGTGLRNIRSRLEQHYGESATLRIQLGATRGTTAEVSLPVERAAVETRATA